MAEKLTEDPSQQVINLGYSDTRPPRVITYIPKIEFDPKNPPKEINLGVTTLGRSVEEVRKQFQQEQTKVENNT